MEAASVMRHSDHSAKNLNLNLGPKKQSDSQLKGRSVIQLIYRPQINYHERREKKCREFLE